MDEIVRAARAPVSPLAEAAHVHRRFSGPGRRWLSLMANCIHGIDVRFCAACANPADTTARRRRSIQMRADGCQPQTAAEREAYEAVYAYEEALSCQKGKTIRAGRTWPMIREHGIIGAVERIVTRRKETEGYRVLVEMGMEDMAFEAVVLRHPESFSREAVAASDDRLRRLRG